MSAKQNGLRYVPFLFRRRSGSPVVRFRIFGAVIEDGGFTSGLRVFWRRSRRETESAVRQGAFLRNHIGFVVFSAGSPLGLRAPNLRQRAIGSLDSLHLIRNVGALYAEKGTRV